jgi:transcription initiation factor TFIIIB Brf1 subunit/transcription initiation factor TFIIB
VDSQEKSIEKGRFEIIQLLNSLDFKGSHIQYEEAAIRFYTLALNKGFTKGRKIQTVRFCGDTHRTCNVA